MELRTALNIVYLILLFNEKIDLESELELSGIILEECILRLIKMSMEIQYVPIKKCIILFFRYLELQLGTPLRKSKTKIEVRTVNEIKLEEPRYR